ncbi:hypothetical protein JKP30_20225 [Vibrio vulnificus]|uniref:hypothetical protein n=1 Tax=Vibrio vulnificus TaxID=672 RepID=UPI001CDCF11E|nr:hypothetical protein [Vibrio vulnificus]MCA3908119.1 hypothetical protein [Vibrio vulnificus]
MRELIHTPNRHSHADGGSIHPHVPEAAFGNVLTATDNNERETNNTNNEAIKPNHGARYAMDPHVREDDEVRELIRTTSCHSLAYGNPFIHTRQKPRLETHSQ